jgi:hypothetical protein
MHDYYISVLLCTQLERNTATVSLLVHTTEEPFNSHSRMVEGGISMIMRKNLLAPSDERGNY